MTHYMYCGQTFDENNIFPNQMHMVGPFVAKFKLQKQSLVNMPLINRRFTSIWSFRAQRI